MIRSNRNILLFLVGLLLSSALSLFLASSSTRPAAAISAFQDYCVPYGSGKFITPQKPFLPVRSMPNERVWINPEARIGISFDQASCRVGDEPETLDSLQTAILFIFHSAITATDFRTHDLTDYSFQSGMQMIRWTGTRAAGPEESEMVIHNYIVSFRTMTMLTMKTEPKTAWRIKHRSP